MMTKHKSRIAELRIEALVVQLRADHMRDLARRMEREGLTERQAEAEIVAKAQRWVRRGRKA